MRYSRLYTCKFSPSTVFQFEFAIFSTPPARIPQAFPFATLRHALFPVEFACFDKQALSTHRDARYPISYVFLQGVLVGRRTNARTNSPLPVRTPEESDRRFRKIRTTVSENIRPLVLEDSVHQLRKDPTAAPKDPPADTSGHPIDSLISVAASKPLQYNELSPYEAHRD